VANQATAGVLSEREREPAMITKAGALSNKKLRREEYENKNRQFLHIRIIDLLFLRFKRATKFIGKILSNVSLIFQLKKMMGNHRRASIFLWNFGEKYSLSGLYGG